MKMTGKFKGWAQRARHLCSTAKGKSVAVVSAAVTAVLVATVAPSAFAGGGGGSDTGDGTTPMATQVSWAYRDNNDGGFGGADIASINTAFASMGVSMLPTGQPKAMKALDEANRNCQARFNEAHPDQAGQGQCRVTGVGVMTGPSKQFSGMAHHLKSDWLQAWATGPGRGTYSNNGSSYTTGEQFFDQPGTSVNSLVDQYTADDTTIVVIMLNKYEPKVASYQMSVSTDQQAPADMKVGSTAAVTDVFHAQASTDIREDVNAHWMLHYDGHPDGYISAKSVAKDVPVHNHGDTPLAFTPADFGLPYWMEGSYWFDVQVAKQGHMEAAVDTPDRDPRETFRVSAVPPSAPVKTVEKGVSADQMVNRTRISSSTGRGGFEMHVVDSIDSAGKSYRVDNLKVTDTTDGRDISNEFVMAWDRTAHKVTADRAKDKGEMPLDHMVEFSFDVIMAKPDFGEVIDHASVQWNHHPSVDTGAKKFPTWRPAPDKSWIKQDPTTGKWAAVIDPDHTNTTGGDNNTYLDGDKVASVVNGTVAADLIQAPKTFTLKDDWSRAAYIFKADDASKIRVYQAEAGSDTKSSVSDIVNQGVDVTDQFDIVMNGTSVSATAKNSYLSKLKGLDRPLQVTMLVPGVIDFAQGKGAEQVRKDFGKAPGEELTFCTAPAPSAGGAGADLVNSASQMVNAHEISTNQPKICGYVPPVHKDVIGESSQGGSQESVDGKTVLPGQKLEYTVRADTTIPDNDAYDIAKVVVADTYDEQTIADKQTLEITDLNTGQIIPRSQWTGTWDDNRHQFTASFADTWVQANWHKGSHPRILLRFKARIKADAPADHIINNQAWLTINNSVTPSNTVKNRPPQLKPNKEDTQQDATINIDGKTALLGDHLYYRITLDASDLSTTAYKVQRLGLIDDYDEQYGEG